MLPTGSPLIQALEHQVPAIDWIVSPSGMAADDTVPQAAAGAAPRSRLGRADGEGRSGQRHDERHSARNHATSIGPLLYADLP